MTSPIAPHIPVRKSPDMMKAYQEAGWKLGAVLRSLYDVVHKNKDGKLERLFIEASKDVFGNDIQFPFIKQTNYLGEIFGHAICLSADSEVAHGRSFQKRHTPGAIISVDAGIAFPYEDKWLHLDAAFTASVNTSNNWTNGPLKALQAIAESRPTNTAAIAKIIRDAAKEQEAKQVVSLTGHGIGFSLHEAPTIHNAPGEYSPVELFNGMCFCAEPIFVDPGCTNNDSFISPTCIGPDGWVVSTVSGDPASHFETTFGVIDGRIIDLVGITKWEF
jgi:methionyl aminopeptidase